MPGSTLLFDAIERYYALLTVHDPDSRQALEELEHWFESRDVTGPDSFERMCRQHKLDASAIRYLLEKRRLATGRG
jgi:hypothetical protein